MPEQDNTVENVPVTIEPAAKQQEIDTVKQDVAAPAQFDMPALFVEQDRRVVSEVEIIYDPADGKPVVISTINYARERQMSYLKRLVVRFEFTHPDYDDMVTYRETAMTFDKSTQQFIVDPVKLRLCFIRFHLVAWTMKDKDGKDVPIERENGSLTADTMRKVSSLTPSLLDVVMTDFEQKTLLSS